MLRIIKLIAIWVLFGANIHAHARFTEVAIHPDASVLFSPGSWGATLKGLRAFNNRLYVGYSENGALVIKSACPPGDWYATSDPYDDPDNGFCKLKVRYFDPATEDFSAPQAILTSQGMNTFEVLNGNLYVLAKDPDGASDLVRCTTSNCTYGTLPSALHVYSATELNGTLYMSGSAGINATIWTSTNNGTNWSSFFQRGPTPAEPNDFSRYYNVGAYNEKIYAHASDYHTADPNFSDVFTDSIPVPVNGPYLFPAGHPSVKVFAGKMVAVWFGKLRSFDGTTVSSPDPYEEYLSDYTISNGQIFVLHGEANGSHIYRSPNLLDWYWVDKAPSVARSLEILDGKLYVGGTDSKLYVSNKDPYTSVVVSPVNYLLLD